MDRLFYIRQNLTSTTDVRFWRIKTVPALNRLTLQVLHCVRVYYNFVFQWLLSVIDLWQLRQNMTSTDVRFWGMKTIPAQKELNFPGRRGCIITLFSSGCYYSDRDTCSHLSPHHLQIQPPLPAAPDPPPPPRPALVRYAPPSVSCVASHTVSQKTRDQQTWEIHPRLF